MRSLRPILHWLIAYIADRVETRRMKKYVNVKINPHLNSDDAHWFRNYAEQNFWSRRLKNIRGQ